MYPNYSHTITLRRSRQEIVADAETPHFKKTFRIPRYYSREDARENIRKMCRDYEAKFKEEIRIEFEGESRIEVSNSVYRVPSIIESISFEEVRDRSKRLTVEDLQKHANDLRKSPIEPPQWRRLDQTMI